jgi:hypothetical protein
MRTYIADIIPRLSKFSEQLDNLTLLTDQHWIALDSIPGQKIVYIFRRNNELLISTNGQVERGRWEFIGKNSILLDLDKITYLLHHGFFDKNILALKVDSKEEYAVFVSELRVATELNSIQAVNNFLQEKYFDKSIDQEYEINETYENISENDKEFKRIFPVVMAILLFLTVLLFISIINKN